MLAAAGSAAPAVRTSLRLAVVGALLQAATYALLVPLLSAIAAPTPESRRIWTLVAVFALLLTAEEAVRVRELEFNYERLPTLTAELRLRIGEALQRMPPEQLARHRSGELAALLGGTVPNAVMGLGTLATRFLEVALVPTILVGVILLVDWRMGVVLLLVLPFAVPLVRRIRVGWNATFTDTDEADADASARIVEYTQGLAVFTATGQIGARSRRLHDALAHQGHVLARSYRGTSSPALLASTLVQLAVVGLVAVGAALVLSTQLAAATYVALIAIAVRFAEPVASATVLTGVFEATESGLRSINRVLSVPPLQSPSKPATIDRFDLALDGVTFHYDGQPRPALRNISLLVPERSFTALVGPSGGGKTTITRLFMRYADPQAGSVRIGGADLRDVEQAELARHVTAVFQDVFLFDDTIAENIRIGQPGATDEEVETAARAAACHGFIDALPAGYETRVGEIGGRLSGGERQRISIARAILKDAPIVLLDEPTAALDAASEVALQRALDQLCATRTVVVIAHRLSTVVGADRIYVVDGGAIVESGTHTDLLSTRGKYADMWRAQQSVRRWHLPTTVQQ